MRAGDGQTVATGIPSPATWDMVRGGLAREATGDEEYSRSCWSS